LSINQRLIASPLLYCDPLIDQDLSIVFYDLTTIRTEGLSQQADDVRQFGMSKEGLIARQFMLGIVQTADGLPIYHEVFDGNASETKTLQPTISTILERFPSIRRPQVRQLMA